MRSQANPAKPQDPNLARFAEGQALAGAQSTLLLFRQNVIAMHGASVHNPRVTSIDSAGKLVSVVDCVDSTNWKPAHLTSGESALAPGQAPRVVVDSTIASSGGGWGFNTSVVRRDQTC